MFTFREGILQLTSLQIVTWGGSAAAVETSLLGDQSHDELCLGAWLRSQSYKVATPAHPRSTWRRASLDRDPIAEIRGGARASGGVDEFLHLRCEVRASPSGRLALNEEVWS